MHPDSSVSVRHALADYLTAAQGRGWHVDPPSKVLRQPWSTLYFVSGTSPKGELVHWVVKCPRAPEQELHLPGRDEDSLAARNRAEFSGLGAIRDHFARQEDDSLTAIEVVSYLDQVEGLVMKKFEGEPLFDCCLRLLHHLRPRRRTLARKGVHRAGAWL